MFEDIIDMQGFDEEADFLPLITMEEEDMDNEEAIPDELPILALKNTVLFPGIVIPITVGRDRSIEAINKAYAEGRVIAVLSQRDADIESPKVEDLYNVGTIARIVKLLRMPDGTITAILQGRKRFALREMISEEPFMIGRISILEYSQPTNKLEFEALISAIMDQAKQIIELSPNIPTEAMVMLKNINNPSFLLNFIASNSTAKTAIKQQILETDSLHQKANTVLLQLKTELQLLELKDKIESKVRGDIEKQQRDYFLNQQLKTIQDELGQNPHEEDIKKLEERAKKIKWPEIRSQNFRKGNRPLAEDEPSGGRVLYPIELSGTVAGSALGKIYRR
jgi:ATP-dependent Lon protease